MHRYCLRALVALNALVPLAVAHPFQGDSPVQAVVAREWSDPRADQLTRALDAIKVENIKADIGFIASDEMAGRDSPSPGLRIAARFLRSRLQRLGFTPGAQEGSFLWEYTLTQYAFNEAESFAEIVIEGESRRLGFGVDYFLSPNATQNRNESCLLYTSDAADE